MRKANITVKDLPYFLSLFNFNVDDSINLNDALINIENIIINDEFKNPVGYLYMDENDKIYVQAFLDKHCFSSVGIFSNKDSTYDFSFDIINEELKEKLTGNFVVQKGHNKKDFIFKIQMVIFKNDKFVSKYEFNTINNSFCIVNPKCGEKVRYKNNCFKYYKNGRQLQIDYSDGRIFYNNIYINTNTTDDICGGYDLYFPYCKDYKSSMVEGEFNKIINENSPEYFEFIKRQKDLMNHFSNNLFENVAHCVLGNFNENQMQFLLDITNESKQKYFIKNKK